MRGRIGTFNSRFKLDRKNAPAKTGQTGGRLYRKVKLTGKQGEKPKFGFLAVDTDELVEAEYANFVEEEETEVNVVEMGKKNSINFIADSGATEHMVSGDLYLNEFEHVSKPIVIRSANKNESANLKVFKKGNLSTRWDSGRMMKIENILIARYLTKNLLMLRKLVKTNCEILLTKKFIKIYDSRDGKLVKVGNFDGRFWRLDFPVTSDSNERVEVFVNDNDSMDVDDNNESSHDMRFDHDYTKLPDDRVVDQNDVDVVKEIENVLKNSCEMKPDDVARIKENKVRSLRENAGMLWHIRLGHISRGYLEQAAKFIPELKNVKFNVSILDCEVCKKAKQVRFPSLTERFRYTEPLRLIHTDLMGGPISPSTYKYGCQYIITFIDDYSRYAWAYPMVDKTEVHVAFESFLENARKILGQGTKLRCVRTDNGTEYKSEAMKRIIEREKIDFDFAPPKISNLNGTAERFNRELAIKIRSLIFDSGFPKQMWAYALQFALAVYNKTPKRSINFKTPFELLHKKPCTVKYFRRFGCQCFVLNMNSKGKFDERGIEGFLVACGENSQHMIVPETGKVYRSKHVDCIESKVYGDFYGTAGKRESCIKDEEGTSGLDWFSPNPEKEIELVEMCISEALLCEKFTVTENETEVLIANEVVDEPKNLEEALVSLEHEKWMEAVNAELNSHKENETWEFVKRDTVPQSTNIMTSRWLFKKKNGNMGGVIYKARLVIRGFRDSNFYDLTETYAPVARMIHILLLLSIANKYDLSVHQMDVKTAFLNGVLEKDAYMEIPDGLKNKDKYKKEYVCKLKKALYGLRVSPRRWYERFRDEMHLQNFEVYPFQACIFIWRMDGKIVIVLMYVDDLLIVGNYDSKITEVKEKLSKVFEMKDMGEVEKFLGLEVVRDRENKKMFIHQYQTILKILKRFDMLGCKPVNTPMVSRDAERKQGKCSELMTDQNIRNFPFREAVGSLLYLSGCTRPDIAFAVNTLSRRQDKYEYEDVVVKEDFSLFKGISRIRLVVQRKRRTVGMLRGRFARHFGTKWQINKWNDYTFVWRCFNVADKETSSRSIVYS